MMGLPQLVQIISKILKTVRDDYICRASPSKMIYSFKNMSKHKNYFVWWEDLGRVILAKQDGSIVQNHAARFTPDEQGEIQASS